MFVLALVSIASAVALPASAASRQDDIDEPVSRAVVQPIPNLNSMNLNAALARLGRDPRDLEALIDAGNAALGMGDVDAAIGFLSRADQISPGNPRVRAGLAGALVRNEDPFDAIPMFDEAERAGAVTTALAADRGLAYDLVGDNETAQRYYRQALAAEPSDEVTRRLALSQAIAGDRRGAESTLVALLQKQDKAAWRARVFTLAILGQPDEAVSIAHRMLPQDLAAGISPYLRYMPKLTQAQQAAAANFGHFPRAAEIGFDDPRIARYARPRPAVAAAAADTRLIPKGEPLGPGSRTRSGSRGSQQDRGSRPEVAAATRAPAAPVAPVRRTPPEPQPGRDVLAPAALAINTASPRPAAAQPVSPPRAGPTAMTPPASPSRIAVVQPPAPAVVAPGSARPDPSPAKPGTATFDLSQVAPATSRTVSAPQARPVPVAAPQAKPPGLSEAFADFAKPQADVMPVAGAVDIRRIVPAREQADTRAAATGKAGAARPPVPSHPSRIWVQVATGRDKVALNFDWRRMSRSASDAFRARKPYVSAWGQTRRLLAGPFESEAAANSFIAQLRRANVSGAFAWHSPAGQIVDALEAK